MVYIEHAKSEMDEHLYINPDYPYFTPHSGPENEKPGQKSVNGLFKWMFLAFFVYVVVPLASF